MLSAAWSDVGGDGVFIGGCNSGGRRWSQREEETLQGRERRSRWLLYHWWTVCWCRRNIYVVDMMVEKMVVAPFFTDFGPDFLLSQAINGASIYIWWKRVISSTPGLNFSHWFSWEGSQPLAQSRHPELSILQKKLTEWACLGRRRRRRRYAIIQTEIFKWGCRVTVEDHFRAILVKFGGRLMH